ncbi:DoxX family protein [Frateuria aurantia]|uniref:Putative membrane protein n=1 Tax=Frateuria aurantia (strain ATCC 33424 / DSM 6220 / KCTC 2777 / LMG 1558 / NBRC 3245 / NCIMB 13370) TaxID=767434 RepID=H8L604_FRAAD|nr:DoxX family protein [Frateuria aurantia]AFC86747.1 putative membrane protein [Frateuria aurantia DSM 6220]
MHTSRLASAAALIGRIALASLFLVSGFGKLAAPAATKAYIISAGLPLPDLSYLAAVMVEVGFGIALVLGFKTRPVAAVMALFTLATALAFHTDFSDQNQFINFLKNVSITGGLLQVMAFGAGAWSLDALRRYPRVRTSLA